MTKVDTAKIIFVTSLILLQCQFLMAQETVKSFELRYFTSDPKANGETDFKGESEFLTTDQRVMFLKHYANQAKTFFNDSNLNTKVVHDNEIKEVLRQIKPQPLPKVRKRIALNEWQAYGYRDHQYEESEDRLAKFKACQALSLANGSLKVERDTAIQWKFSSQSWRFSFSWRTSVDETNEEVKFVFSDKQKINAATVGFGSNGRFYYLTDQGKRLEGDLYQARKWYTFKIEFDMAAFKRGSDLGRYSLYIDGEKIANYVPMECVLNEGVGYATAFTTIPFVNTFVLALKKGVLLDDLHGIGYALTGRQNYPYTTETFFDEDFELKQDVSGWQSRNFRDNFWKRDTLPIVHGSERHEGEDLFLRKKVYVNDYKQAYLNIETLDPGGEVWVNGMIVEVIKNRHPQKIELSNFLHRNDTNLIAVKVNHFYLTEKTGQIMPHSSLDFNIGWFAGRMSLDLMNDQRIENVFVFTEKLEEKNKAATLKLKFQLVNRALSAFKGSIAIKITPWFPSASTISVVDVTLPIRLPVGSKEFAIPLVIKNPSLWSSDHPALYSVEVILKDQTGQPIDDVVTTAGIRTISQEGGTFRINGDPSMLNGAQVMGFRSPIEKMILWQRCPPIEWLVKELLMIRKMNGNMMRVHVHAWEQGNGENINDPRIAELADQLGVMLIWATPSWIRTGTSWRQIDFEGYPKYIRQVYNHPSIVMWEAANHTQSFPADDITESNLFCEKVYSTVYPVDPSRLISFNSYIHHLHYGNDNGTRDTKGKAIKPSPAWTAPMVTRGNQDGITGYSSNWTNLRNWPDAYRKNFLSSASRAYFNFEHEESMAQDNWNLAKGKPWYKLHSYEWDYDIGTIGRRLTLDEWEESQAWQAFSAWESMKKQRILDYDGFSWCSLHGGPNSATYKKPIIDFEGHAKLGYWANKMIFQPTVAGSSNVDVVYGPDDELVPVIIHWGNSTKANLFISIKDAVGKDVFTKKVSDLQFDEGRTVYTLEALKPSVPEDGFYSVHYTLVKQN